MAAGRASFIALVALATMGCEPFTGTGGSGSGGAAGNGTTISSASSGESASTTTGCSCTPGPNATASCDNGQCVYSCQDGFGDCDSDPSTCETDLTKDGNCGACNVDCATTCIASGSQSKCNDPIEVTAGSEHTCALRADGTVWCWGGNEHGQCGTSMNANPVTSPTPVTLPFVAVHVVARASSTCAWSAAGAMACWGNDGSPASSPLLYTAPELQNVKKVSLRGDVFNLAPSLVLSQLGGSVEEVEVSNIAQPTATNAVLGAIDVAAGGSHWCVLDGAGAVRCWGANGSGQLGQGSTGPDVSMPTLVNGISAKAISAGLVHTCAVTMGDAVVCWGGNTKKQSGGMVNPVTSPQPVGIPGAPTITALTTGFSDTAVIAEGKLYLWGANDAFQVSPSGVDESAATLYAGLADVSGVALGDSHTCALLHSGVLRCWGHDDLYQLGDGNQSASVTPVDVKWPH